MIAGDEPIRPLRAAELGQVGRLMARAFDADPLMRHAVPDDSKRGDAVAWLQARIVRLGMLYGHVDAAGLDGERLAGLAVWMPPGWNGVTLWAAIRSGFALTPIKVGWSALRRLRDYGTAKDALLAEAAPSRYWYVMLMAVDPEAQGRGVGRRLMEAGLRRADSDRLPSCLDTANGENLPFFEKQGFGIAATGRVQHGGHEVWLMLRQPTGGVIPTQGRGHAAPGAPAP